MHAQIRDNPCWPWQSSKIDNQRSEAINNVVKEEGKRKGTDQINIHELIEERVVEDQRDELIKAIG